VPILSPLLRGPPIIVFEDTSQPFLTLDGTVPIGLVARLLNRLVVETLVIALTMVMLCVFLHGFPKVALAQRDDLGQTLGSFFRRGAGSNPFSRRIRLTVLRPTS